MAEIIVEPTALSKVIPLKFKINDVDVPKTTQLSTNKQFNTTDTDAWFTFELDGLAATNGTYDLTLINLDDKSIFHHDQVLFPTLPFHYKLNSSEDVTLNEIRHAGRWLGQLVVTLSNGDTTARQFGFNIAGHILDGQDAQVILLSDYQALINTINLAKDDLAQYNIDFAALIADVKTAEGVREQAEIDRAAVFAALVESEMVAQNVATKLTEKEATFAPRMLSLESELADTLNKSAITLTHMFADNTARDAYFVANPTELIDLQFIKVGTAYQQYIEGVWTGSVPIVSEQLSATNQPIVDTGNYFATDNTNAALQELGAHKVSTSNPHGVTKAQVGLGSVDNTSDANKPVSTATQTALNLKANKVQEAWFTPTLINGWVSFGGAEAGPTYYKDNFGNVKLRGVVKSGTLSVSIFDLPIGYRPAKNKYFAVISNNVPGFVLIDPSGGVIPLAGTSNVFVTLDSISFKVD